MVMALLSWGCQFLYWIRKDSSWVLLILCVVVLLLIPSEVMTVFALGCICLSFLNISVKWVNLAPGNACVSMDFVSVGDFVIVLILESPSIITFSVNLGRDQDVLSAAGWLCEWGPMMGRWAGPGWVVGVVDCTSWSSCVFEMSPLVSSCVAIALSKASSLIFN